MLRRNFAPVLAATLCLAMLLQIGCAGRARTSSFYVLSPVAVTGLEMKTATGGSDISIGISPVTLPKYLRKSQIVTRTGSNELQLAEYDRWAGKIEEDIGRVIAENLGHMLATDKVLSSPSMAAIAPDYTVKIDINRFEGSLGGDIELIVRWAIFDNRENIVHGVEATQIIEPTGGKGYADLVAAQSRALAAFSRKLADVIKELPAG